MTDFRGFASPFAFSYFFHFVYFTFIYIFLFTLYGVSCINSIVVFLPLLSLSVRLNCRRIN